MFMRNQKAILKEKEITQLIQIKIRQVDSTAFAGAPTNPCLFIKSGAKTSG